MNLEKKVKIEKVRLIPHFRGSAAMNLAKEEALFFGAVKELKEKGTFDPVIGVYSFNGPCVILGNQQPIREIDLDYCAENGIEVTMRRTGGGSVYLTEEEIQYFYILPFIYSREILRKINSRIKIALTDVGFSPQLKLINNYHVLRMNEDNSFVFDAQRMSIVNNGDENNPGHVLLHHGTILVDSTNYDHMPFALKASKKESERLRYGNFWLRNGREVREFELIQTLRKHLPFDAKIIIRDLNVDELKSASDLHDNFYRDIQCFNQGKKPYGICYLPGKDYDMSKYRTEEVDV